ncbi:MAG TPA: alpha-amylase, partial [Nitrospirae bacterium]|nr:alpha-amylase [Nitrospirota bacterium]
MKIYNLFPLLAGRFNDWHPHLERAASMGFDWVFTNPVQEPGISGSLYSIKHYHGYNRLLVDEGSGVPPEEQLKSAMAQANRLGLCMMTDLVINHCAVDSPLVNEHPEWFRREKSGKVAHPWCMDGKRKVVWGDLARFDHKRSTDAESLYAFVQKIIGHLVSLGFRGFRCDAAYQLPPALWTRLIAESKTRHGDIVFAAETLGCTHAQTMETARAGFDHIFNSSKWWDLKSSWLLDQHEETRALCPSISFPESHDTLRLFEELNGNLSAIKLKYLFSAFFSSSVMMPMGFEFGFRKRPHVVKL